MLKASYRTLLAATFLLSFIHPAYSAAIETSSSIPSRSFEFKGSNTICTTNGGTCLSGGDTVFDFTIAGLSLSNGTLSESSSTLLKRLMLVDFYRPLNFPPYPSSGGAFYNIFATGPSQAPTELFQYSFSGSGLNAGVGQESDDYLLSYSSSVKIGDFSVLQVSFMATPDQWFLHTQEGHLFSNYSGAVSMLTELPVPQVPLPGSLPLLLSGLAGLLAVRRR